ncbi:MAG: beta-ketoacyl synthase N-terminal-like domain-containing protein, partial [Terriglobales bacterium]
MKRQLARTLKLAVEKVEVDAALEKYGVDSVLALRMVGDLERVFGRLPKTLLFEQRSVRALVAYFMSAHRERLQALLQPKWREVGESVPEGERASGGARALGRSRVALRPARSVEGVGGGRREGGGALDIAIVGISGRYPQARTLEEFWENLRSGKDCITEIPAQRWDHSRYFGKKGAVGKCYSKWGGFIEGVEEFDALFFNISPREAQYMDPQERLFLQCVYETLEDAGHTRESVGGVEGVQAGRRDVGVFVGVMYEEYQLYAAQAQAQGRSLAVGGYAASIANRVSYYHDFSGPSLAVDTMCSSSLTAIHLACESLRRGECVAAIAGGVNVSIHPNKYLLLSQGQFVSSEGLCRSFGEGGDGYVPGEGVGAVLLKPLRRAQEEGDHIYGVIKASAINHGGRTNGYTVPSPQGQAQVIDRALRESGLSARQISYIEAHGTGTALGDPIEIAGLAQAFGQGSGAEGGCCAIGSVKSNIGHCESAAGIAALTKVLLQMKHGLLVPSLHSEVLNPHIDFERTPFVVQRTLQEWRRPLVGGCEVDRVAGISSFGAGGANAHLIVAEYRQEGGGRQGDGVPQAGGVPQVVVLSGKSEERVREQTGRLLRALSGFGEEDLGDIAYTLQVGREALEYRLATVVGTLEELRGRLQRYVQGEEVEELYVGEVKRNKEAL